MDKFCFLCKEAFQAGSLKTSRSRFNLMGLVPPEGMGYEDKICSKCLHKIYDTQVKQKNIERLKKAIKSDLIRNRSTTVLPKNIYTEKKKKFLQ